MSLALVMHRERLAHEPPLLDAEAAVRLAEAATAFLRTEPRDDHELADLAYETALDAGQLALETAIDTGDPRVLAAALELALLRLRRPDESFERELAQAAEIVLASITAVDNGVRDAARSCSDRVRAAAARALGPRARRSLRGEGDEVDAEAAAIVTALAQDASPAVRGAAREALGGAAPPAWLVFYPRDPLAMLPAAEAARLRGPLDRAAAALERGVRRNAAPLAEAIAELPDDLAAPILEAWIREPLATLAEGAEALLDRFVALDPEGERAHAWLCTTPSRKIDALVGWHLAAALRRGPPERACAVALRMAVLLEPLRAKARFAAYDVAETIVGEAWPADEDPTPLVEITLGASFAEAASLPADDAVGPSRKVLEVVFRALPRAPALLEALIDALVTGFPGRFGRIAYPVSEHLLDHAHPRLRAFAEHLLRHGEGGVPVWGLRYLIRGGHDPSLDPPPAEMLAAAARDPRLRNAILRHAELRGPAEAELRRQLAAGELPPDEAVYLARWLRSREGPSALAPDEWAAVRRARGALEDVVERASAVEVLPPYPEWTPEDHAFVGELIELAHDPAVAIQLARGLQPIAAPPVPDVVPLLDRLLERAPPDCHDVLRSSRDRALARRA